MVEGAARGGVRYEITEEQWLSRRGSHLAPPSMW